MARKKIDLDAEAYGEDVADVFPLPTIVVIKKEPMELRPITVDMLPRMIEMVKAIGADWTLPIRELVAKRGPEVRDLAAYMIDRPPAFVGGLDWRVYSGLVGAILAEYADFFYLSVGLLLGQSTGMQATPKDGIGSTLSDTSNGADTSIPASTPYVNSTPAFDPLIGTTVAND